MAPDAGNNLRKALVHQNGMDNTFVKHLERVMSHDL